MEQHVNSLTIASIDHFLHSVSKGDKLSDQEIFQLMNCEETSRLMAVSATLRDRSFGNVVTYSRKVFIPLTHLCRDVCHYCTFAQVPKNVKAPFMPLDDQCH